MRRMQQGLRDSEDIQFHYRTIPSMNIAPQAYRNGLENEMKSKLRRALYGRTSGKETFYPPTGNPPASHHFACLGKF
ncbi:hypothetical protein N7507_003121 [Penicillium longicatenatum]|nr:hypothetical protein N7507_003121 [Penicillium longicatenatum]